MIHSQFYSIPLYHRSNAMLYLLVSLFQQRLLEDNCRWHVDIRVDKEIVLYPTYLEYTLLVNILLKPMTMGMGKGVVLHILNSA